MKYTRLRVKCPAEYIEVLIAEMAEAGFDMFLETQDGFEAHAAEGTDFGQVNEIRNKYAHLQPLEVVIDTVEKENWNEEWEKNVSPIVVENRCLIRAEFHKPSQEYTYEIIITPKMSFGTGHHQTTYLMVKAQLEINHQDKRVMDAGCGTAILSVMASKRGATEVEAFDIDEWSILNGKENAALNRCTNIRIRQGTVDNFTWGEPFDIILANINKNVLLDEIKSYARHLVSGGILLLSGFYATDIPDLIREASRHRLRLVTQDEREKWAVIQLAKQP